MRAFLLANGPGLAWAITAFHALILLLSIRGYGKSRRPLYLLLAFLSFGLCYDALIQALGTLLGEGSALFTLSRFRYVFHGALIPLLFPILHGLLLLAVQRFLLRVPPPAHQIH